MSVSIHSLYWDNVHPKMLESHQMVMNHFGISVHYDYQNGIDHGLWMNSIVSSSNADLVVFLEPDCVPIHYENMIQCMSWTLNNQCFLGLAQVANHMEPRSHIYAAPGFYCITKYIYNLLEQPTFASTFRSDIAEEICYIAESKGIDYRALRPDNYERLTEPKRWRLGCLGYYGIGTVFENTVYHLFESRNSENIDLFKWRCDQIVKGNFSIDGFVSSIDLGNIADNYIN